MVKMEETMESKTAHHHRWKDTYKVEDAWRESDVKDNQKGLCKRGSRESIREKEK